MIAMNVPEYLVSDFLKGRYQRLTSPLHGIYVRELVRYTDTVDPFLKMFEVQDHLIATLFFEQQLNPMLKAYTQTRKISDLYQINESAITAARITLKKLCENACVDKLIAQINAIENLEANQKKLQDNFYCASAILYPMINTNYTAANPNLINNNIQHIT